MEQVQSLFVKPDLSVSLEHDIVKDDIGPNNLVEPTAGEGNCIAPLALEEGGGDFGGEVRALVESLGYDVPLDLLDLGTAATFC